MVRKVLITGATGWLGQEYLYRQYSKRGADFLNDFILVGSTSRIINLFNLFPVQVYSLEDTDYFNNIEGVVHLAFVLRHRVQEFGTQDFMMHNKIITNKVVEIVKKVEPSWIVNVSSGAIFDRRTGEYEKDPLANPYGYGKRQEEIALSEIAAKYNISLVIGRLWGASGFKMPPNHAYALSDFIESALTNCEINIHSNFEVFRRYCDAGEFLDVLVSEASSGNSMIINSGGPLHEIEEIAQMILANIGYGTINRPLLGSKEIDDYYPRESTYEKLAKKNGIKLASMPIQVQRTVNGHLEYLKLQKKFLG
jgi:nucleoside-diphosphate-sugar epimerase